MSRRHDRCGPDHVERYLRRLARWAPRKSRHDLVMEASRHLYEATRRAEEEGLTRQAAQSAAIRAFGPAWRIGLSERGLLDHPLLAALDRAAVVVGARLCGLRRLRVARVIRRGRRPRPRARLF
jgi:hypothetical protein